MNRKATSWLALGLAAGLSVFTFALTQAAPLAGPALVAALRQGGYVILMRHTSSPALVPDRSAANPDNTTPERQLDKNGEATATAMGAAIKKLGIPVGDVLSSPTYRALQTVKFAGFGTAKTAQELGDGGTSMAPQLVSAWASWLKTKVAEAPRAGTDTFIVSHSPNITSAYPDDAKGIADGEALVFHPDGKGGAELVARIKVEEWPELAK